MTSRSSKLFGSGQKMFARMLWRAALGKRATAALVAMAVAAAVATTLLNVYGDAQARLREQFRSYGANVVVIVRGSNMLPADALARIDSEVGLAGVAAPFAYAVARTSPDLDRGTPVVIAGTDLQRVKKLNTWWSVTSWPVAGQTANEIPALFGERATKTLAPRGERLTLWFHRKSVTLIAAGTLKTGGDEDSRIYIDLAAFTAWTGERPASVEVAISGTNAQVNATMARLQQALPAAEVKPIQQIVEGEARVLGKTRSTLLAAAVIVIFTAALCVLATLIAWVLDRRRDFALMKALGASETVVTAFFAAEAGLIGAAGALVGFSVGIWAANWIGRASFGASVAPQFGLLPPVIAGGLSIALAAALGPMAMLRRIQPAAILRGE